MFKTRKSKALERLQQENDKLKKENETMRFALDIANEENYKLFMLRQEQIKRTGKYQDKNGLWREANGSFTTPPRAL